MPPLPRPSQLRLVALKNEIAPAVEDAEPKVLPHTGEIDPPRIVQAVVVGRKGIWRVEKARVAVIVIHRHGIGKKAMSRVAV